jgi:hypothetical protein
MFHIPQHAAVRFHGVHKVVQKTAVRPDTFIRPSPASVVIPSAATSDARTEPVGLMNLRRFEPHLDCVPAVNVADDPTRFKHNPHHGVRGSGVSAFRDFHTVNKDKDVIVIIPVKLTNGFVAHAPTLGFI